MEDDRNHCIVLLQSRMTSSRLPGKALLPICGIPTVVLAAQRASNTGLPVKVVTSIDPSDDILCDALDRYDINYFRGSLDNVLQRFNDAVSSYGADTRIIRLTADNVLPDGEFLAELKGAFDAQCVDILGCDPTLSGMPYGLSAEITTVGWIREANLNASDQYQREHVTPYIYKNGVSSFFTSKAISGDARLRVTVDTFEDYLCVSNLFADRKNPQQVKINAILKNYHLMKYHPQFAPSVKPMALGTAQLGLDYGIVNVRGKVPDKEAISIIRQAITEGISYIDTAAVYGDSERIIGQALRGGWSNRVKVVTKVAPVEMRYADKSVVENLSMLVQNSYLKACVNLETNTIDTLMLHRMHDLELVPVFNELQRLKTEGKINNIGVSVQSPGELEKVLKFKDVSLVQMPFNILDNRWDHIIHSIQMARLERGLIVHARSALLQGLLCVNDENKWMAAGINNYKEIIAWLLKMRTHYKYSTIADICIAYVNGQDWIDTTVLGVTNAVELSENLKSISQPLMPKTIIDEIRLSRPKINSKVLDPSTWSTNV